MHHKRHRQPLEVNASMNITNLLDTAFILLITFMLVAPQLTHGLKIDPPQVDTKGPLDVDPGKTLQIVIQRTEEGEASEALYIQETRLRRVTLEDIQEEVAAAYARHPDLSVVIQGDRGISWEIGLQVIAAVQRVGVSNIGIQTILPREAGR